MATQRVEEEREVEIMPNAGTLSVMSKAEIDVQISTAHAYPRSLAQFHKRAMEMLTLNQETALECFYTLPRGGKKILGPSIRLAEIVACSYGNLRAAGRVANQDGEFIYGQGICHDLENNLAVQIEVSRRITNKEGNRYDSDMIGITGNAAISIAYRNAVLRVVPKALWRPLYEEALKIARGDITTLEARRKKMLEEFKKLKVSEKVICDWLEVKGAADIGLDHLVELRGIYTAIINNEVSIDQAFELPIPGRLEVESPTGEVKVHDMPKSKEKEPEPLDPLLQPISHTQIKALRACWFDEKHRSAEDLITLLGTFGYEKLEEVTVSDYTKIWNAI